MSKLNSDSTSASSHLYSLDLFEPNLINVLKLQTMTFFQFCAGTQDTNLGSIRGIEQEAHLGLTSKSVPGFSQSSFPGT